MMNCSGATAVASVRACGARVVGGRVAVFGGGPLGLLTALRAADVGATEVTVVDKSPAVIEAVRCIPSRCFMFVFFVHTLA